MQSTSNTRGIKKNANRCARFKGIKNNNRKETNEQYISV